MNITIENKSFKSDDIKKLYPATIVKTGMGDETTQISLEWLENESNGAVEVVSYGVFINLKDGQKHSFLYKTREEFDEALEELARQF